MRIGIERTTSGEKTLYIEREGKKRYLYSRYDPRRDGVRFYEEHPNAGGGLSIFIGLGLGYHIRPYLADRGIREIVVLEPCEELYQAVKDSEEIHGLLKDPRVSIHTGGEALAYTEELAGRYDSLLGGSIKVLSYSPLAAALPEAYCGFEERIRSRLELLAGDGATIGRFAYLWLKSFSANVKKIRNCALVSSLFGSAGGTAVVTGAGPSLDGALGMLKAERKRYFLVSTDASAGPLIVNGIRPDLIVSVDPQPLVRLHFRGHRQRDIARIPAVLSLLSCPEVFDLFEKKYLFFTHHPSTQLFETGFLQGEGAILNYRSVGCYALKVTKEMGFSTIVLAGFDFSCPGFRMYARDTFFHDYGVDRWDRFTPFPTLEIGAVRRAGASPSAQPARSGGEEGPITASRTLREYLSEFEGVVREGPARVAAAGGGHLRIIQWGNSGMAIEGAEVIEHHLIEKIFHETESKPSIQTHEIPVKPSPFPDLRKLDPVRRALVLTLALRNRIFRGVMSREEAMEKAERTLEDWAEKWGDIFPLIGSGYLKFETHSSDI